MIGKLEQGLTSYVMGFGHQFMLNNFDDVRDVHRPGEGIRPLEDRTDK